MPHPAEQTLDRRRLPLVESYWRERPIVLRELLLPRTLSSIQAAARRFSRPPVVSRLFVQPSPGGSGTSRLIDSPVEAWDLFQSFRNESAITLLLNGVEQVYPDVIALQNDLGIPYDWRRDDVVCSFSSAHGGIGYHAGAEDGFVLQISGRRRWRVWDRKHVSAAYQDFLLGLDHVAPKRSTRPQASPLLDCVLEPGDALYTPALFAHEGETLEDSVSISIAWKGISFVHLALAVGVPPLYAYGCRALCKLVPDVLPGQSCQTLLTSQVSEIFDKAAIPRSREMADQAGALWARLIESGRSALA